MIKRLVILSLAAASLTGCASVERIDAASDVHAFLIAIRDNDRAAFNARVDRPAIKLEVEGKLDRAVRTKTDDQAGRLVGALLAGPLARTAVDAVVQPSVFRAIAVSLGYSPDRPIPGQFVIAQALRYESDGRVCAAKAKDKPCLLTWIPET